MRKSSLIAKPALALLGSIKRARRVDLQLSLTNFSLMAVLADDIFKELHDITRHDIHPVQTSVSWHTIYWPRGMFDLNQLRIEKHKAKF